MKKKKLNLLVMKIWMLGINTLSISCNLICTCFKLFLHKVVVML